MHEAVRCATVINAPGLRLEAAEQVTEDHIVATTSDGTLLSLKAPEPSHSVGPWQVVQAVKSFSRKPVTYIRYLQSHGYVLTQADDGVGLFELATLGGGGNTPLQPSQPPTPRLVGDSGRWGDMTWAGMRTHRQPHAARGGTVCGPRLHG